MKRCCQTIPRDSEPLPVEVTNHVLGKDLLQTFEDCERGAAADVPDRCHLLLGTTMLSLGYNVPRGW